MTLHPSPFFVLCCVFAIVSCGTLGKTVEDYFLSKCSCSNDYHNPNCDFSKLSKENLQKLVNKLLIQKIVCIQSYETFFTPSFTSSFHQQALPTGGNLLAAAVDSKGLTRPELSNPPPTVFQSGGNCVLDGISCSSKLYGIEFLFPTTLLVNTIVNDKKTRKYNEDLKNLLLDLEEENDGCTFNLHGGYRSKDGFLSRPEPAIKWLKSQIKPRVQTLLSLTNSSQINYSLDGWGAVLRAGDGQNLHVHPSSIFAGVYYVAAPAEVAASGKSHGCIRFIDPRMGAAQAQVVRGKDIYGGAVEICPEPEGGLLILFPSWIMHQVFPMPATYSGPRIAISFNVVYQP